ncbi:MAG: DUF72 domain-containing protein [Spirochaetaceae bacterium]|nr:DUF72 domain-containing protein [Spirochaetaceae bacterium]
MDLDTKPLCDLRIGTSGYDYPEWEGVFYSSGIGRSEYLGAYSEAFDTVELNFSYYGMPKPQQMVTLLGKTRRPIDFSIKAHKSLTHSVDPGTWESSVDEFIRGVSPLAEANRLCAVLLEFPFSFHYRDNERRYLDRVLKALAIFPLAVEFRNAEWLNSRVIESLKTRNIALCALDMPKLEGLPPASDLVTSDIGYVRFHGRNAGAWWDGDAGSRYEYRYSKEELALWLPRIESMGIQAKKLRIYFNNHRHGNAATNARNLVDIARAAKLM